MPSRGSQARTLLSEADTTTEWSKETLAGLLEFAQTQVSGDETEPAADDPRSPESDAEPIFRQVVDELIEECRGDDLSACRDVLRRSGQVPQPYDGRLLATSRTHLGRDLTGPERSQLREIFRASLNEGVEQRTGADSAFPDDVSGSEGPVSATLEDLVEEWARDLNEGQIRELHDYWRHSIGVPPEHDRPLLASCRERIGRDLTPEERGFLRKRFQDAVEKRFSST